MVQLLFADPPVIVDVQVQLEELALVQRPSLTPELLGTQVIRIDTVLPDSS